MVSTLLDYPSWPLHTVRRVCTSASYTTRTLGKSCAFNKTQFFNKLFSEEFLNLSGKCKANTKISQRVFFLINLKKKYFQNKTKENLKKQNVFFQEKNKTIVLHGQWKFMCLEETWGNKNYHKSQLDLVRFGFPCAPIKQCFWIFQWLWR